MRVIEQRKSLYLTRARLPRFLAARIDSHSARFKEWRWASLTPTGRLVLPSRLGRDGTPVLRPE